MPIQQTVKLNTGAEMPVLGLGTWKSAPGEVELAVEFALKNGYKHIDTATAYANEAEVGKGIKASGVPRESFFLTTKLANNDHTRVEAALAYSLKQLDTDYLDLWLMHWPAPMLEDYSGAAKSIDWLDTWKSMVKLHKAQPEKVRAIGVSNMVPEYLERLLANSEVIPATNQIESHPSCPQEDIIEFCRSKGIIVTAYSPLGSNNSPLLANPVVTTLAEKYKVEPSNILISLQANKPGVTVIPKSVTNTRIATNLKVVELTSEEIQQLQDIGKTSPFRVCDASWTGWGSIGFK
ncbi:hypothetical protein HYPSUDRAFT_134729 [Hypholoma sublateritium FD-334 SS-4]|uniref:NADP-dependent oxidoreductase domain-containing protein n=1 Tax=Hypholoma sublateritium (strain FD-334 SS-4) TaxID=945553 RepID=A0A0D2LDZ3_HYPSF|nr:hypothetical protein HYPSUDRAFT_134729 [Hypholoma sublateritium FD-334 SS-4]